MSSTLSKLTERLAALEEEVALMKMSTAISSMTEGLRLAEPEEAKEWVEAANKILSLYATKTSKASKTSKAEKKATTNERGPSEWNVFVEATWIEMAAAAGVLMGDGDDAKAVFKKAAGAAGVSYQSAMKEASVRKAANEGRVDNDTKKAAAKEKREAKKAAAPPAVKKAAPINEPTAAEIMAELGIVIKVIDGTSYMICEEDGEAFLANDDGTMGDRVGIYDADTNTIEE